MTAAAARGPGRPRSEAIDIAILDATVEELIERGYIAMSIESVAARAGVAKTTLYRRWPNVEELALAALRRLHGAAPAVDPAGAPREQLLTLLDRMRTLWSDPRYAAIMRRVAADGTIQPAVYRECRTRLVRPHIAALNAVLRRAIEQGVIVPGTDVDWVRMMLTAPILAAAMTLKRTVSRPQLEFTVDTVLAGLAPQAE